MNRFTLKISAVTLSVLMLASVSASAKKTKKPKKNQDLSANPLSDVNTKQPDKELYDKAMIALKKGRFDVARLDLQTLLNTYPDSEFRMRAKLSVGDSWFKEGGTAALTQAESEYKDFITFFPTAPEAAEAQMKVGDIYFQQMEKPDRDYTNVQNAEREYRAMITMFPDSSLIPRAKQRLRETQEVLAERETQIGLYYLGGHENYPASIARLQTVSDTYPLYSKSDQVLLAIGDAYAGEAHAVEMAPGLPGNIKERLRASYLDKAAASYARVVTKYPMAAHVEDARDRLVAMNRTVPEPTPEAVAESDAMVRSEQPMRFTDRALGLIKHGPAVMEAVHVGEPSLDDPKRTTAAEINKQNIDLYNAAVNEGRPAAAAAAATPTGANEPPRSDQPSSAPLQMGAPSSGTGLGVSVVDAPNDEHKNDPIKPVGPTNTVAPPVESAAPSETQINDIKQGTAQTVSDADRKKPKVDSSDESSSKKKKKKGLSKINPF